MTTVATFHKFGKLCFLAFHLAELENLYQTGQIDRFNKARASEIRESGLDTNNYVNRRLCDAVEYSVEKGLKVLTIHDNPFWDMDDEEFSAFMALLNENQIREFVYESRDSSAYETIYRLESFGWKMAGLTRRLTEIGKRKERDRDKLERSDYIYGIKIKKNKKN